MEKNNLKHRVIDSPIGPITLTASVNVLVALNLEDSKLAKPNTNETNSILDETEKQLHEYFRGQRTTFNIPLAPEGTEFQKKVWKILQQIPYGQSISYGEQAKRLGKPKATRAVGGANGKNPIAIIIPCHRVIGANGSLTGFASGLDLKQKLLNIEGVVITPPHKKINAKTKDQNNLELAT